jgi:hypothetical protein
MQAQRALRHLALIAILGIGLGLFMQALIVTARLLSGGILPSAAIVADISQSVTWSALVCTGVAIGMSIGKARHALAGIVAGLFAPLALATAKGAQKFVLALIDVVEQPTLLSVQTLGLVRAVEYGLLAWLLTLLSERKNRRLLAYAGIGALVAAIFGGGVSAFTLNAQFAADKPPSLPGILSLLINELGAPIGCALVIYVGQLVAINARIYARGAPPEADRAA